MILRWTKKFFITIIGFGVLILGLILIPLPGPGLLVCALGLGILTFEYEWAQKHFDQTKAQLKKIVDQSKTKNQSATDKEKNE